MYIKEEDYIMGGHDFMSPLADNDSQHTFGS